MPQQIDQEVLKKAIKEAITEWMDSKFTVFGRWTFSALAVAAFGGAVYLALRGQGWSLEK